MPVRGSLQSGHNHEPKPPDYRLRHTKMKDRWFYSIPKIRSPGSRRIEPSRWLTPPEQPLPAETISWYNWGVLLPDRSESAFSHVIFFIVWTSWRSRHLVSVVTDLSHSQHDDGVSPGVVHGIYYEGKTPSSRDRLLSTSRERINATESSLLIVVT
jgi:hypothetical protein